MAQDILFVGHSLVGKTMPNMLSSLIGSGADAPVVDRQVINGSPLVWNWSNGASAEGVNARAELPSGRYGIVVVTEAVPLDNHLQWSDTFGYAKRYYDLAVSANPDTRFYIYETWHSLGSTAADLAAWRARLTSDRDKWAGIVDHINTNRGAGQPEAQLVPAGAAMAALYDAIAAGQIPGISSIRELFSDDIHLNDLGNYYLTMVQYATLLQDSPVGLSGATTHEWGAYQTVPAGLALAMQSLAWDVAQQEAGGSLGMPESPPVPDLVLTGQNIADELRGNDGNDTIDGQFGNDRLYGGDGNDSILGGGGYDRIWGGAGDDTIFGGAGADLLVGEDGNDRVLGGRLNDTMHGGAGADTMFGQAGADILYGGNDDDLLDGGKGPDRLFGGNGNDTLIGGASNDVLTGGAGADVFVLINGGGGERIVDFNPAEGDRLQLAQAVVPGSLDPVDIVARFGRQDGSSAWLELGGGHRVMLEGYTDLAGLHAWIEVI